MQLLMHVPAEEQGQDQIPAATDLRDARLDAPQAPGRLVGQRRAEPFGNQPMQPVTAAREPDEQVERLPAQFPPPGPPQSFRNAGPPGAHPPPPAPPPLPPSRQLSP